MPRYYLFKKCEQRNNGSAAHSNNYGATADIKDQASGNYVYNAIGELNYDRISSIDSMKWNVYGKIQHIYKHAATYGTAATGLHYYYDPSGNRVGRAVLYNPSTSYNSYTWYVRDAQGNVLAAYRTIGSDITTSTLKLIEHHMYGSSRLGIINRDMDVDQPRLTADNSNAHLGTAYLSIFTRGNKLFELTNHLGNVLVTVTDVKTPTPKSGTPSQVGGYIANMVVATDYTPFGMIMQGRNYNNAAGDKYRYGFNGKEYDNAVKGTGNEIDYGERPYDPMGGRFWSVDPLASRFPWQSPYVAFDNNPINKIDPDGRAATDPPTKLYHNTEAGRDVFTKGFNATTHGKYSNYNWFSTTENAAGTGRVGQGVSLGVEGVDVSSAQKISIVQTDAWKLEAMKDMGYTKESFKAASKTMSKEAFSALNNELNGRLYSKVGEYMNSAKQAAYFLEKDGTYAVSDALANSGTIKTLSGSSSAVSALNGLKWAGRTLVVVAAAKDLYDIYNSGFEPRTIVKKAGFWTGAWAGGAAAGAGYAATGLDLTGPWGWVGHAGTTLVGGIIGGFAGEKITETVYDYVTKPGAKPGMQ